MISRRLVRLATRLLSIIVVLACVVSGAAVAGTLSTVESKETIGEFLKFLQEDDQQLSLEQALGAYTRGEFSASDMAAPNFGIGSSPVWLSATIDNTSTTPAHRRLVIETSWLDLIDIYVIERGTTTRQEQMGDSLPFSERPVDHRFFIFDHDYTPGLSQLVIRVTTPDPMVLPIFFGSPEDYARHDVTNSYSYGVLYGIVIALLLYNAIIFFKIRQARYLFYVIYLFMFLAMNLSYTGHGYFVLWPESAWLEHWGNPVLITLYVISGITFSFSFLQTRRLFPGIFNKTLALILAVCVAQLVFIALQMQTAAVVTAIGFVMFFSVLALSVAIISLRPGHDDVRYFLIASVATLLGSAITAMAVWGIVPYSLLTFRAVEIGISIDVILLSFALAEQLRLAQEGKLLAEQRARVDALTGLYNRGAFNEMITPLWHNAIRHNSELAIIIMDIDQFKAINDTHGHVNGDEVLIKTAYALQKGIRKGDILARWGGEEFTILLPETGSIKARQMAERLRSIISDLEVHSGASVIKFTASFGLAFRDAETTTIDDLIQMADRRLYEAKKSGRDRVCC